MADIAAAAGVGRATAWRHLGSREELIADLWTRAVADARQALAATLPLGGHVTTDALGAVLTAFGEIGNRYRALRRLAPPDDPRLGDWDTALAPLREAVVCAQRIGTVRDDIAPEMVVTLLVGAVASALETTADAEAAADAVAAVRRVLVDGLAPGLAVPASSPSDTTTGRRGANTRGFDEAPAPRCR